MAAMRRTTQPAFDAGTDLASGLRVRLRVPTWADQDELLELRRRSWDFLEPWEPDLPGVDPLGPAWFARYMRFGRGHGRLRLLVCGREDGRIYGSVSLGELDRSRGSAALGYWIGAEHARRGLMTEALELAREQVFPAQGLARVEAYVLPENEASRRLLLKLGFVRSGIARDYRTLRGEPRDHQRWVLAVG
jgi:ribosomal-protein-alanine N-acetyltransferase